MIPEMQFTQFTHGKCRVCGYMALLDKFENKKINETKQEGTDGFTAEMYQLVVVCPVCGNEFCEALFPNEVN